MLRQKLKDQLGVWYKFITRQNLYPDVDPLIANSWQRCLPRLDPHQEHRSRKLSSENLLSAQSANFDLISIARPIMEDIHQFIEHSATAVMLINYAGYILDILGDAEMMAVAADLGFVEGALISEDHLGTNAFALALIERVPTRVVGPDHFLQQFHELAGAASPVFDPAGKPLGVLGLLTLAQSYHPHTLGIVVAGGRALEAQRQSDILLREQISQLTELNAILASISEGLMVLDNHGILMNANPAAGRILDFPLATCLGRPVAENLDFPPFIIEAVAEGRPLTDVDATLAIRDRNINCLVSIRFAGHAPDRQWTIMTLREGGEVRQMIQHQVGPQVEVQIEDFAGRSRKIQRMRYLAKTAAPARASILIRGESGTGKDYLARALHFASPRRRGPFVIFGCSSVPNELAVEELFGFEQAAGGGGRPSKFELAHNGTLFFQDIEVLPMEAQALLLNVLELGIIQRLGSTHPIAVDVRILASTTASLENLVADGHFRADLFYRLSPFEIEAPPLRERLADVPVLVDRILTRLSRQHQRNLAPAAGVMDLLQRYHWPGNMRELEAVLERAVIQAGTSDLIGAMHLPNFIRHPANLPTQQERLIHTPTLETVQREAIIQAARACNGNITQMARVLGIGRTTVWRKLKDLNISVDHFRQQA